MWWQVHQLCASPHKANESPWKREKPCLYCDSCEVPLLEHVINAHCRLLRIPEHSTFETHYSCYLYFTYCSLLLSYYPTCSTFVYTCPCPLEGIINIAVHMRARGKNICRRRWWHKKNLLISKVVKNDRGREIGRTHQ